MSRPSRTERLANKARPKRRAAKTHFFKYQLAYNPSRAEDEAIKRALEESLKEQASFSGGLARNNGLKVTKNKQQQQQQQIDNNKLRCKRSPNGTNNNQQQHQLQNPVKSSNSVKNNTPPKSTPNSASKNTSDAGNIINKSTANSKTATTSSSSKKVQISPPVKATGGGGILKQDSTIQAICSTNNIRTDCLTVDQQHTQDLSKQSTRNQNINNNSNTNQTYVKLSKKRTTQGSWSLLGVPEEKLIYLRDDLSPRRLICYPAIKHIEGDVIQVKDSVLLRSGGKKTDLPYIAKVCAFWEDAESGNVMMSLYWYYRPEHTEEGRKAHHLVDEIFASRHKDMDSVECIEDKCYVLTFNEYCRYRKRCKMEQIGKFWSLTDLTIPVSNEIYPRFNRIPDSNVNPELVFCCRQIYDSRTKRLVKNPLINSKYGHI